ncbi:hypothetical protein N7470_006788 [Penicillium chermesinum]|nr:hypothetical protein N7470_006788 [Penicillium chermesinum]
MSTDSPNPDLPKDEGVSVDADKTEGTTTRRASTTRRSRRKKDEDDNANNASNAKPKKEVKEKQTRAPRRPREKSNATPASRKKAKLEQAEDTGAPAGDAAPATPATPTPATPATPAPAVQSTPTPQPAPAPSYSFPPQAAAVAPAPSYPPSQPYPPRPQSQPPPPQAQPPSQRTSGQNFDPIRSAFDNPSPAPAYSPPGHTLSPPNYRASASPAISSIIDPPIQQNRVYTPALPRSSSGYASNVSSPVPPPMLPMSSHPSLAPSPVPASSPSHGAIHAPQPQQPPNLYMPYMSSERPAYTQPPKLEPSSPVLKQQQQQPSASQPPPTRQPEAQVPASTPKQPQQPHDAMEIDPKEPPSTTGKKDKAPASTPSSKAVSPKPARAAKEAPKLPQGSGLIQNALFGVGGDDATSSDTRDAPNIVVHIPLSKGNHIINFAQLAEEQYGFAALHPRLAAHKERLARVAAAGAALEKNDKGPKGISAGESAEEDLSVDNDRDSDVDGDVSMIGATNGTNGAPSEGSDVKKKRRKKVEEYDRDDPFVDDSELAWQEQAAASKDGFFVFSGPLVSEGEKVQVERADGTIKRGRGRGRGTGRGRSLASHPHVPIAAAVPISQDTGLPLRGPGSRGGTSRRARTTKKADQGEKHGTTSSPSHDSPRGRGGGPGSRGGGAGSTRGAKAANSSSMPMVDLAPAPPSHSQPPLTPAPGPSPLAGPELAMK